MSLLKVSDDYALKKITITVVALTGHRTVMGINVIDRLMDEITKLEDAKKNLIMRALAKTVLEWVRDNI